jgi:hypothetical protein
MYIFIMLTTRTVELVLPGPRYTQTDSELVVRACVPIRQGEEITTQYRKGSLRQELRNMYKLKG